MEGRRKEGRTDDGRKEGKVGGEGWDGGLERRKDGGWEGVSFAVVQDHCG